MPTSSQATMLTSGNTVTRHGLFGNELKMQDTSIER